MRLRGQHRSSADSRADVPRGEPAPDASTSRLGELTAVARELAAELPQEELLQRVADSARQLIGANQAAIRLTTGEEGALDGGGITAPLIDASGDRLGLIHVSDKLDGQFTAEDEELLAHLGQLAVLAIDSARVRREAGEAQVLLDAM